MILRGKFRENFFVYLKKKIFVLILIKKKAYLIMFVQNLNNNIIIFNNYNSNNETYDFSKSFNSVIPINSNKNEEFFPRFDFSGQIQQRLF